MFRGVYHIGYMTDDKERAIALYRDAFGGEVKLETTNPDGAQLVFMRIGETEVEIIQPADITTLGGKSGLVLDHVGYVVDDLDSELARLESRGFRRLWPEPRLNAEGARLIYMDPATLSGVRMHLTERPRSQ